jgi:hypothetical protein
VGESALGKIDDVSDLDQLEAEIPLIRLKAGERASSSLKSFLEAVTELISNGANRIRSFSGYSAQVLIVGFSECGFLVLVSYK